MPFLIAMLNYQRVILHQPWMPPDAPKPLAQEAWQHDAPDALRAIRCLAGQVAAARPPGGFWLGRNF